MLPAARTYATRCLLGREVRAYYSDKGAYEPVTDAVGAVVCTYEKANGLVNRLLEEESLGDLSCIVVDELHMVRRRTRAPVAHATVCCAPAGDAGRAGYCVVSPYTCLT